MNKIQYFSVKEEAHFLDHYYLVIVLLIYILSSDITVSTIA